MIKLKSVLNEENYYWETTCPNCNHRWIIKRIIPYFPKSKCPKCKTEIKQKDVQEVDSDYGRKLYEEVRSHEKLDDLRMMGCLDEIKKLAKHYYSTFEYKKCGEDLIKILKKYYEWD